LGVQFQIFKDAHPGAQGLSGEDKDPAAYIDQHSG
ncbi:MAG: hemerythrin domain-containing protein, partial [Geodermatophilaceae bacterium]|nr:hemerythrin domain-containing protein [Geodermatophilaceae bacterium]